MSEPKIELMDVDDVEEEKVDESQGKKERVTTKYMTKYERARVLGTRALQIRYARNSLFLSFVRNLKSTSTYLIEDVYISSISNTHTQYSCSNTHTHIERSRIDVFLLYSRFFFTSSYFETCTTDITKHTNTSTV